MGSLSQFRSAVWPNIANLYIYERRALVYTYIARRVKKCGRGEKRQLDEYIVYSFS